MRLLSIDTSERFFSVAIVESGVLVAQVSSREVGDQHLEINSGNSKKALPVRSPTVAVHLFPMIQALLRKANVAMREIELMAVATGPGMFTGLRSGVVAAKTLAYGLGIPLVAVNTLEVMAWQAAAEIEKVSGFDSSTVRLLPVVNAQRQQLFAGFYEVVGSQEATKFGSCQLRRIADDKIMDRAEWMEMLQPNDWVTGTGLTPLISRSELEQKTGVCVVQPESWPAMASTVGTLAWRDYMLGRRDDMWTLEPFYFRPSYAEE